MRTTEEKAKTTWCPMTRVLNFQPAPDHNFPINRPTAEFNCLGSGCMMWRWLDAADAETRNGFCGLAGIPF